VDLLAAAGREAAMLHFSQLWPLAEGAAAHFSGRRRIVSVEGNATGQFAGLLRERGLVAAGAIEHLGRYDGLPFDAEYIVERLDTGRGA
jgi:2-oxoglutarate ferredoxin oxidoreductase subunit alpha